MKSMRFYFLMGALLVVFTNRAQYMDIEEPHRLGGEVNSEADELFPVFSKVTSTLYLAERMEWRKQICQRTRL